MVQKKIIIVGATSGLGSSLAVKYAEKGWRVGITGRREENLILFKEKYPGLVYTSCFDVQQEGSAEKIRDLITEMGGLDIFIYNAGYGEPSDKLNWEIEKTTLLTNINGLVETVHFVFNYFIDKGEGQIAMTSSVAAVRGNGSAPAYSASKSFMRVYAEGLNLKAAQLKKNIVVTELRPGFMDTKMAKSDRLFWVVPVDKAASQIMSAIENKKRVAYISGRWRLIGLILRNLPFFIYKRIV